MDRHDVAVSISPPTSTHNNKNGSPSTQDDTEESGLDVDGIIQQLTAAKFQRKHTLVCLDLHTQIYPLIDRALELIK